MTLTEAVEELGMGQLLGMEGTDWSWYYQWGTDRFGDVILVKQNGEVMSVSYNCLTSTDWVIINKKDLEKEQEKRRMELYQAASDDIQQNPWDDLKAITEFYKNCPPGYHVEPEVEPVEEAAKKLIEEHSELMEKLSGKLEPWQIVLTCAICSSEVYSEYSGESKYCACGAVHVCQTPEAQGYGGDTNNIITSTGQSLAEVLSKPNFKPTKKGVNYDD